MQKKETDVQNASKEMGKLSRIERTLSCEKWGHLGWSSFCHSRWSSVGLEYFEF